MNNKRLGTAFERELCTILTEHGFWVHFITPSMAGAQPFDIVAVKNNVPIAIDCKTSARPIFPISRLEDNQVFAFERWLDCGNEYAVLAVKYQDVIYFVDYEFLKEHEDGKVRLSDCSYMGEWMDGRF